jgi:ferredoxin-type protein NapH
VDSRRRDAAPDAAPDAVTEAPPRVVARVTAPSRPRGHLSRALRRARWLLARRVVQVGVLAAFASGPWLGVPVAEGTLAASRWLGVLPLADPLVALQALLAGHELATAGLLGAAGVALFYALLAGRLYCAWVCPVNLVTDAAEALRRGLGLGNAALLRADRGMRHVVLVLVLLVSAAAGVVAWEMVNPITLSMRALVFGAWSAGTVAVAAVFVFDLVVLRRGWCGHLCPVGAFYGWLGRRGRLSVHTVRVDACTRCGDCYAVCPEPHVIVPVLRSGATAVAIGDPDCLRCGRCIDHCDEDVFALRWATITPTRSRPVC